MSHIVALLTMVALAYVASFALSSRQRLGYGLVSGAEFIVAGALLGPSGLSFIPPGLLEAASTAIAWAVGWLGFRYGLRLIEAAPGDRQRPLVLMLEPLASAAALWLLLSGANRALDLGLSGRACWALTAIGAPSTRSGILWAIGRLGAGGPLTERLRGITRYDDLVGVLLLGALFASEPGPTHLSLPVQAAATVASGLLLAGLAAALLGRRGFREDRVWVAVLGLSTLGTGLAITLGISSLAVATLFGLGLGLARRQETQRIALLSEPTERPTVQVLLVLVGAQLSFSGQLAAAAVLFAALRMVAKLGGGAGLSLLVRDPIRQPWLGSGLLSSGGLVTAMALSAAESFPSDAQPILWGFVAFSICGDLVGSRLLVALLRRAGETGAEKAAEPQAAP